MQRFGSEEGSILIQVAIGLMALMGFSAFVFDWGTNLVARNQTQNIADAGALAGAVARAFDEPNGTPAAGGITEQSIQRVVQGQYTLGAQTHTYTQAWNCPPSPIVTGTPKCVTVNVFRDGSNSSATLPVFFSQTFGMTQQVTRATATAIAATANGSNCLKPWLIPDKYIEVGGNPNRFDLGVDQYTAPGWTLADVGTTLTLSPGNPQQAMAPSMFFQVDVNNYYDDIVGCELMAGIGDDIDTAPGLSLGLTRNGVGVLTANGPVVVPIGMFSPVQFEQNRQTGHYTLTIVNMMGFRIEGMTGNSLYGTIVGAPGDIVPGGALPPGNAAFLQVIRLVQ